MLTPVIIDLIIDVLTKKHSPARYGTAEPWAQRYEWCINDMGLPLLLLCMLEAPVMDTALLFSLWSVRYLKSCSDVK